LRISDLSICSLFNPKSGIPNPKSRRGYS